MNHPSPKVTLLTYTSDPLESVYALWEASKNDDPLMSTEDVKNTVPPDEVEDLFKRVIQQKIPIGEHVHFTFMLEHVSVSWREQAVRHRIGTKPGPERLSVDIGPAHDLIEAATIPNLAESSWWSQSMRIMDMSKFAHKKAYRLPETVANHPDPTVAERFHSAMLRTGEDYAWLVNKGIPMEDARELIGLGAQHRISWDLNIGSLQHILGKRGCWILQLGLWGPVIMGMVRELTTKVHPVFSKLVTPPCINGDTFGGCVYHEECERRFDGRDALPPCPLHMFHHYDTRSGIRGGANTDAHGGPARAIRAGVDPAVVQGETGLVRLEDMVKRARAYRGFWNRDPYTGRPVDK